MAGVDSSPLFDEENEDLDMSVILEYVERASEEVPEDERRIIKIEPSEDGEGEPQEMVMTVKEAKKHATNWTWPQKVALFDFIVENWDIIEGNISSTLTRRDKDRKWEEAVAVVNKWVLLFGCFCS